LKYNNAFHDVVNGCRREALVKSWYWSWVHTSDVQLLDFVNDRLFWFILYFRIKDFLLLRKKSKLENCRFGLFWETSRTSSFDERTGEEPTVRKALFFEIFKKIENQGPTPKPDFRSLFAPMCRY
jgi:hypothetical protein